MAKVTKSMLVGYLNKCLAIDVRVYDADNQQLLPLSREDHDKIRTATFKKDVLELSLIRWYDRAAAKKLSKSNTLTLDLRECVGNTDHQLCVLTLPTDQFKVSNVDHDHESKVQNAVILTFEVSLSDLMTYDLLVHAAGRYADLLAAA